MKTTIYVDGFNLYYGCLRHSPYKWLNLQALFQELLPRHQIDKIHYFTARVKPLAHDQDAPQRQKAYLRALETLPEIEIHYGLFTQHQVRMANAEPPPNTVEVIKTEEKGSDVNFSVHLLNDAWRALYDCAVLVTNDSDMAEAMRLVKSQFPQKKLGLITPTILNNKQPTNKLNQYADFHKRLSKTKLATAQFDNPVTCAKTKDPIYKPTSW